LKSNTERRVDNRREEMESPEVAYAIVKGLSVAALLVALRVDSLSGRWWVAMLALNTMINI
jgi:hypothetical protein